MPKPTLTISGVILVQTCGACPEQYDAYIEDKKVGYLRLRHGCFYACCPYPSSVSDFDTLRVYEANTMGDGAFEDEERDLHLAKAVAAIKNRYGGIVVKTVKEILRTADGIKDKPIEDAYRLREINASLLASLRGLTAFIEKYALEHPIRNKLLAEAKAAIEEAEAL